MTIQRQLVFLLTLCLMCFTLGCTQEQASNSDTRDTDLEAIKSADAAWAQISINKDWEGSYAYFTSDAVSLVPHAPIAEGIEAIRGVFDQMQGLPGFALSWKTASVEVSSSGDLGYSFGSYELSFDGADGAPVTDIGKYMTVWKKQADGAWKVALDMFNTDLPQ